MFPVATKNRIVKRAIFSLVVLALITSGMFVGYGIYEEKKIQSIAKKHLNQRERVFASNPNLIDCLVLMDNYWELKQFNKALYYANYCVRLDADKTNRGWYVHLLIADIFLKSKDYQQSCTHAKLAKKLAQRDKISTDNLSKLGFEDALSSCQQEQ